MKTDLDPDILEAVDRLVAREGATQLGHPSPAELFAFANSELDDAAADELREHLAICADCGDWMLAFEPPRGEHRAGPAAASAVLDGGGSLLAAVIGLQLAWQPSAVVSPALLQLAAIEGGGWRNSENSSPRWPAPAPARSIVLALRLDLPVGQGIEEIPGPAKPSRPGSLAREQPPPCARRGLATSLVLAPRPTVFNWRKIASVWKRSRIDIPISGTRGRLRPWSLGGAVPSP